MTRDGRTHHAECWRDHLDCAVREVQRLRGAMASDDERLRAAAERVWGEHPLGCDTAEHLADEVERLRERETGAELALSAIHDMVWRENWRGSILDTPEMVKAELKRLRARQLPDELREEARRLLIVQDGMKWRYEWEVCVMAVLRRIAAIGEDQP